MLDSAREPRFLRWLDLLLSEPLRQASPLERSRARVTGGMALLFMVMGLLFVPFTLLTLPNRWSLGGLNGFAMLGQLSALLLLRRRSTARPAALVLCTVMGLTYVPTNLLMNDTTVGIHAVSMLLPLISIYLLGERLGLIISVFFALCSLLVFPLYFRESTTDFPRFWGSHAFAALSIMGGWMIGRLNGAARDAAQASLEQTLKDLAEMHRTLMDVSRQAGMAEMAVGVLHNVGNTLNSVNVSAMLLDERLRSSRVKGLARASSLMQEHTGNLAAFLTSDERGRQLPRYFSALSDQLLEEQMVYRREIKQLLEGLEHIKRIVNMQQEQARIGGMVELVPVPQLIDDALRLKSDSFDQSSIQLQREYQEVPPILVDRHKLLQILVNLLNNAHHALLESGREDKVLTIRIGSGSRPDRLRIAVADNGVGIPPENLQRIFAQGFTTKKTGHGFGLHISALSATEMGGTLTCESAGRGHGAVFTLELPVGGRP